MKIKNFGLRTFSLILFIALSVSSCKKDKTQTDNLVGTWTSGTPSFTVMVGTKTLAQYYTDVMGLTAAQATQYTAAINVILQQSFAGTFTVKSDNTYTSNLGGVADSGTWSLSPDGKTLTIDSSTDLPQTLNVISLTASQLQVGLTDVTSQDLNGDGTPETLTIAVTLSFTKK